MRNMIIVLIAVLTIACPVGGETPCRVNSDRKTMRLIKKGAEEKEAELAIEFFAAAIARDPEALKAFIGRSLRRRELGDYLGAAKDLSDAIRLCPELRDAYEIRAKLHRSRGDQQGYEDDIRRASEAKWTMEDLIRKSARKVEEAKAVLYRAKFEEERGNLTRALKNCDEYLRLLGRPPDDDVYLLKASIFHKTGDYQGELEAYQDAIKVFPERAVFFFRSTVPVRKQLGDFEGAMVDLEQQHKLQLDDYESRLQQIEKKIRGTKDPGTLNILWEERMRIARKRRVSNYRYAKQIWELKQEDRGSTSKVDE